MGLDMLHSILGWAAVLISKLLAARNVPARERRPARSDGVSPLSSLAYLTRGRPTSHRWRQRFLGHESLLQPTEIAIVEQPTDHVLRDLIRARVVELVAGCEFEPIIEPVNCCHHTGADESRSLNHRGTGEAAIRMTVVQPKERHISNLAPAFPVGRAASCHSVARPLNSSVQLGEIERHMARLVHRHNAGVPCGVRCTAVEHTKLQASGILDSVSIWQLDDSPGQWEAVGHGLFCLAGRNGFATSGSR